MAKDYAAIARQKIHKPYERPLNVHIYGKFKRGKTTFISTAPDVLIIDPEEGTDELVSAQPDIWSITRWQDMDDVYKYLRTVKHPHKYIGMDGMTRLTSMALRFVMKMEEERDSSRIPGIVDRRDYGKAGELIKGFAYNIQALGLGMIYASGERQVEVAPSYGGNKEDKKPIPFEADIDAELVSTMMIPDLPNGVRGTINSLADVVGRIYIVKVDGKARRRLWISPHAAYDTSYRSDFDDLPDYLTNPTLPRLENLIRNGV